MVKCTAQRRGHNISKSFPKSFSSEYKTWMQLGSIPISSKGHAIGAQTKPEAFPLIFHKNLHIALAHFWTDFNELLYYRWGILTSQGAVL